MHYDDHTDSHRQAEFEKWGVEGEIAAFVLDPQAVPMCDRVKLVKRWFSSALPSVLIIGFTLFTGLVSKSRKGSKLAECLVNPGADIVVVDEGHIICNTSTRNRKALERLETRRRIVLTGTPLQNHLKEYQAMVDFVHPGQCS